MEPYRNLCEKMPGGSFGLH